MIENAKSLIAEFRETRDQGIMQWQAAQVGIGRTLTSKRKQAAIDACAIAGRMGISTGMLSMLESGKRNWSEDLLDRWFNSMRELL